MRHAHQREKKHKHHHRSRERSENNIDNRYDDDRDANEAVYFGSDENSPSFSVPLSTLASDDWKDFEAYLRKKRRRQRRREQQPKPHRVIAYSLQISNLCGRLRFEGPYSVYMQGRITKEEFEGGMEEISYAFVKHSPRPETICLLFLFLLFCVSVSAGGIIASGWALWGALISAVLFCIWLPLTIYNGKKLRLALEEGVKIQNERFAHRGITWRLKSRESEVLPLQLEIVIHKDIPSVLSDDDNKEGQPDDDRTTTSATAAAVEDEESLSGQPRKQSSYSAPISSYYSHSKPSAKQSFIDSTKEKSATTGASPHVIYHSSSDNEDNSGSDSDTESGSSSTTSSLATSPSASPRQPPRIVK
eukprot:TRINITY_DN16633_c0_g1_i1.p1 TRINITY_DN16633_c0_g1~~TRINITY_DN16633_c0_g1_i1.p1  ORF type:complete len:361 (+),score=81.34 TRINITY_DN16633_c0_g1_i1:291-1373(+)